MSNLLPEQITDRFLRSLRKQFYSGQDKRYFQERNLILQAITWPARWLDDRGVKLPAKRYTEILTLIIRTIVRHGKTGEIRSFGRYLLHAVQEHMRHHGEDYYDQAKSSRIIAGDVMQGITKHRQALAKAATTAQADRTVPALAEVHRILSTTKPARRKTRQSPDRQQTLF